MALRYPAHRINSIEKYVAESITSAAAGATIALTDRTLVRLAFSGNGTIDLEAGTEDGLYRILIAETVTGTTRLENSTTVLLVDRAWLPQNVGEAIGLIWNAAIPGAAPLGRWCELWRSIQYDSSVGTFVKNGTAAIIAKGAPVYISGSSGANPLVSLASNATEALSAGTMGIAHDAIPINGFGYIISAGPVDGINVGAAAAGDPVYLGPAGTLLYGVAAKPVAPAHFVKIGNVIKTGVSGSIQLLISNGFELEELHNVLISAPANNDVLTYETASSLWKNKPAGGGGGSPSIGGTITGGTAGSILFVDPAATIAQDNANFFWDNANNKMGIGINTPDQTLHVHKATSGVVASNANAVATLENSTSAYLQILNPAANEGGVLFGSPTSAEQGGIIYNHATDTLTLRTGGNTARVNVTDAGTAIGLGTTIAETRLEIGGVEPYITMPTELTSASPTNPTANKLILIGQRIANRGFLAVKGAVGHETALQPYMAHNKVGYWSAAAGSTVLPSPSGINFTTAIGTITARTVATTNALTRMARYGIVSAATAAAFSHQRTGFTATGAAAVTTGNAAAYPLGGFQYTVRFGISDGAAVAGARMFIGLRNDTAAPTNVEPSTIVNCVGIAQLSTDATQLYIVYGGTTAQAAIPLGAANFPANNSGVPFELALYSPSDTLRTIYYEVTNLSNGNIATGTLSGTAVQVPDSGVLLTGHHWRTNNATLLAVGLDVCSVYLETDQ